MRVSVLCAAILLVAATPSAQLKLPPPGTSLDLTVAEREAIMKAYPGARGTQVKSIDAGKHVIQVWVDQLKAGDGRADHGEMHSEVSEVYVIVEGAGTLVTGGMMFDAKANPVAGSPSYSGRYEGGVTRQVKAGDVVINPPGTVHSWKSIDSPRLIYMNVWIDPEKRLKAGYVDPALKKTQ